MKALVMEEYKKLVYRDFPSPVPAPDEVLVQVKACGICGSDIHGYDGSTGRRIPPVIMGHEASGIIAATGEQVKNWKTGDRVTFDSTIYNPDDWYSRIGRYNISDGREVLGVSPGSYRRHGAFAEFVAVPEHILYKIPDNISFEQAAMTEAAAVALHAINISEISKDNSAAVTGTGMIGIFLVKLLRIKNISPVIAIDIDQKKLAKASLAGAHMVVSSTDHDIVEKIKLQTEGRGVDFSFEAAGKSETVNLAIDIARRGGTITLVGNTSKQISFPLQKVVTSELRIQASCAICGEYKAVLDYLASGELNVDDQISAVAPLSEGKEWFDRLYSGAGDFGKVILIP